MSALAESASSMRVATWHPLADGCAPDWASGWGQDAYGPFVEIRVADVTQPLRWIPPGRFQMGSPEDEPGRFADNESPRHWVTISQGFWLFDTPCPQKLWAAVMGGDNPSLFKSPDRPVDQVSWEDCQQFIERINTLVPGRKLSLPTEAEWEYACRAGITDATYAGPIQIHGINNAPALDTIAWYGGNCGSGFDLKHGFLTSNWLEKQYDFDKGGTRIVATKDPNKWGLFDMLGNVLEWCRDGRRTYADREEVDPIGPEVMSISRVVRGGSWLVGARYVRPACRAWARPVYRDIAHGFRCRAL